MEFLLLLRSQDTTISRNSPSKSWLHFFGAFFRVIQSSRIMGHYWCNTPARYISIFYIAQMCHPSSPIRNYIFFPNRVMRLCKCFPMFFSPNGFQLTTRPPDSFYHSTFVLFWVIPVSERPKTHCYNMSPRSVNIVASKKFRIFSGEMTNDEHIFREAN